MVVSQPPFEFFDHFIDRGKDLCVREASGQMSQVVDFAAKGICRFLGHPTTTSSMVTPLVRQ